MTNRKKYLISVPFSLHVWVEAENERVIDSDAVYEAILNEHGKYPQVDARDVSDFGVLDFEEIPEAVEDLFGVEFVDPYLGRDDVVWAVNAVIDDETVQAEIIASDDDSDLGTEDAYAVEHVKNFQIPS